MVLDQQAEPKIIGRPIKPASLVFIDAKTHLVNEVNKILQEYQVPFWLLEIMLNDIFNEVKAQSKAELEQARTAYSMECAKWDIENTASEAE